MKIITKDAVISNTGDDEDFPGTFEVILSTEAEDRDGDTLKAEDWEQPLPGHITFDTDHGMSVATTVGSGTPSINEKGQLVVAGTYSSLPRAQEARTLVKEGHIRTTSVAFLTKKVTKAGGKTGTVRELLNGAFVAVPSNREALVLAAKALGQKAGARNSRTDAEHIQAIHDHALALGAQPDASDDTGAAEGTVGGKAIQRRMVAAKAVAGSYEQRQQAISDALSAAYPDPDKGYIYAYPLATFDDSVVYRVSGDTDDRGQWQASYTVAEDGSITLGEPVRVNMVEQVVPVKGYLPDDTDTEPGQPAADSADSAATKAAESADSAAELDIELELKARSIAARAMAGAA